MGGAGGGSAEEGSHEEKEKGVPKGARRRCHPHRLVAVVVGDVGGTWRLFGRFRSRTAAATDVRPAAAAAK